MEDADEPSGIARRRRGCPSHLTAHASCLHAWLTLARVSNLPTVWTNTLTGALLGGAPLGGPFGALVAALSLLYVGGMILNDAFDWRIDAVSRPRRPIPSGRIAPAAAFLAGSGCLFLGLTVIGFSAAASEAGGRPGPALAAGLGLVGCIVLYDWAHKANPVAPVVMGLCRGAVYPTTALALTGAATPALLTAALVLAGYVAALTALGRRRERLMPQALAGISLVDGALLLSFGHALPALAAGLAAWATSALQRLVRGT